MAFSLLPYKVQVFLICKLGGAARFRVKFEHSFVNEIMHAFSLAVLYLYLQSMLQSRDICLRSPFSRALATRLCASTVSSAKYHR